MTCKVYLYLTVVTVVENKTKLLRQSVNLLRQIALFRKKKKAIFCLRRLDARYNNVNSKLLISSGRFSRLFLKQKVFQTNTAKQLARSYI